MKRIIKGSYGYLRARRKQVLIRTIVFFAISLSLFIAGYIQTKTKQNLITIVAVLGCLPACKSLVNTIIYFRARGCKEETMEAVSPLEGRLQGMYDMYFTSYQKNYPISHMVVENKIVLGLAEDPGCDGKACQEHLTAMLKQAGFKDMVVKISAERSKYCEQLVKLNEMEPNSNPQKDDEVRTALHEISL